MMLYANMVESTWIMAEIDGKMVGCELMLGDGGIRFLTCLGLDYNASYIYFQMFYEEIRYAIEHNIQVLRAGSTAYEVKERMGFELDNSNSMRFAANNRSLNKLISKMGVPFITGVPSECR